MTRMFKYIIYLLVLFGIQSHVYVYGQQEVTHPESKTTLILGEQMYREGLLSSGKPMIGIVRGDLQVPGTSFTCISCHMRSGLGSVEGGVLTTPTNGKSLFTPRNQPPALRPGMGMGAAGNGATTPKPLPPRPAYTDETLTGVLRGGVDPAGRVLDPVMPRYNIPDHDMKILVSYLKSLSSDFSPGVDATTLHFATIITSDVQTEIAQQQISQLEDTIKKINELTNYIKNEVKNPRIKRQLRVSSQVAYRNISLSRWTLKGPPESWRVQLEDYYRKEPVFALLGGITTGSWKPIHEFSESNRIPCLFPQTDFPVISDTNNYTLYLSKGYYQEGETAARYINRNHDSPKELPIVQIIRDTPEGRALSTGFTETWLDLGHRLPETILFKPGETITGDRLNKLLAKEQPTTMLVWDGPDAISILETVATHKHRPASVFVSSSYFGKKTSSLPEQVRDFTYITTPYKLPLDEERLEQYFFGGMIKNRSNADDTNRILKRAYPLNKILIQALSDLKENFYRDYLLDVISMNKDLDVPLYERLSFGPGQRYASKGCYIVQLSKGPKPEFIKKSDWVIH